MAAMLRALPETWGPRLRHALAGTAYRVFSGRRRIVESQLVRAFGAPPPTDARAVYVHLTQVVWDFVRLRNHAATGFQSLVPVDAEVLEAAVAAGRGVIVVTGHLGSWELAMAGIAALLPVPTHVLTKSFGALDLFISEARTRRGVFPIRTTGGPSALRAIRAALRRGEVVVMVIDQHAPTGAVTVPFFGRPAATVDLPARMADRSDGPALVWAEAWYTPDGHHHVRFAPVNVGEGQGGPHRRTELMTDLTRRLEAAVRARPAQWLWTHRRWKVDVSEAEGANRDRRER